MIKHNFYGKKQQKNAKKVIIVAFFILNSPHLPVKQHAPNVRETEKIQLIRN